MYSLSFIGGSSLNKSTFPNFRPETPDTRCQLRPVIVCLNSWNLSKISFIRSWPLHYKKRKSSMRRRHMVFIERGGTEVKLSLDDQNWDPNVSKRLENIEVHTIQRESINCSKGGQLEYSQRKPRRRKNVSKRWSEADILFFHSRADASVGYLWRGSRHFLKSLF